MCGSAPTATALKRKLACIMRHVTLASDGRSEGSTSFSASVAVPHEVFYVVQSKGVLGERDHRIRSDLYETRPQADT